MKKLVIVTLALLVAGAVSVRAADAKENWDKHCAKCHGKDGKGQTVMGKKQGAKDYTDAKVQDALKDDEAFKAIKQGFKHDGKEVMKPAEGLSDDEIKGLVGYLRKFKK
jgi:cytochrome c553